MEAKVSRSNPALDAAIGTVRTAINKTPAATLAIMYREVAQTTHDSSLNADIKQSWADTIQLLSMSNDDEIAAEFKLWIEKAISVADPRTVKDFLSKVLEGIVTVSRRS